MDKKQMRLLSWYLMSTVLIVVLNFITFLLHFSWFFFNILFFSYFIFSIFFLFTKLNIKDSLYIRLIPIYEVGSALFTIILSFQHNKIDIQKVFIFASLIDKFFSIMILVYSIYLINKYKLQVPKIKF